MGWGLTHGVRRAGQGGDEIRVYCHREGVAEAEKRVLPSENHCCTTE